MPETALLAPKAFRSPDQTRKRSRAEWPANPIATHPPQRRHRTIFISDTHLGTRGCKAEWLADFLAANSCATLYLVGDIADFWQVRRWYWSEAQDRVVREILRKADHGTRVVFVPGNHDETMRPFCGRMIAGIEIVRDTVHETADGRRLLVIHGDQFDGVIACARWLAHLGDHAYGLALRVNDALAAVRRQFGLPYWSLSAWLKHKVKNAVEYIGHFEDAVAREVRARGLDGAVCGHIHHAAIRDVGGVLYANDGDWVESCTALVEDASGHLEILRWADFATPAFVAGARIPAQAVPIPA
jgi:UDP-2,3-diacylglucosamine pyrophosphatase LpxH